MVPRVRFSGTITADEKTLLREALFFHRYLVRLAQQVPDAHVTVLKVVPFGKNPKPGVVLAKVEGVPAGQKRKSSYHMTIMDDGVMAVTIFLVGDNKDPWVLMKEEFRYGTLTRTLEPPAGFVDPGSMSREHDLLREIHEETGVNMAGFRYQEIGKITASPGLVNDTFVCATDIPVSEKQFEHIRSSYEGARNGNVLEGENTVTRLVPLAEALKAMQGYGPGMALVMYAAWKAKGLLDMIAQAVQTAGSDSTQALTPPASSHAAAGRSGPQG
ncbi:MAG: NUDIX domain-containing protein [Pseudomonadota bacterium]|nr:NUDIX domain-containing protein [Pseudomonadota bacterium]